MSTDQRVIEILQRFKKGDLSLENTSQKIKEVYQRDGSNDSPESDPIEEIRKELEIFFANNRISWWKVERFALEINATSSGYNILPDIPWFDECCLSDAADRDIKRIGKKYGVRLGWIHPK